MNKKSERLLDILGQIDEDLIEDAAPKTKAKAKVKRRNNADPRNCSFRGSAYLQSDDLCDIISPVI